MSLQICCLKKTAGIALYANICDVIFKESQLEVDQDSPTYGLLWETKNAPKLRRASPMPQGL